MNLSAVLSRRSEVEAVLNSSLFDPISKVVELASGPTAALRNGMARFSSSDRHPERRLAVVDELTKVDLDTACEVARRRTEVLFVGQPVEVVSEIAFRIPSEVLCVLLDLSAAPSEVIADLLEIVQMIGVECGLRALAIWRSNACWSAVHAEGGMLFR